MKLLVLGATGATGRLLVDQALQRGHEVVAYVRRPDALDERPRLRIVGGELTDTPALTAAVAGVDAVLVAIGPKGVRGFVGADLMRRTLPVLTTAMAAEGVRRMVLLSAYGVGDTAASASPLIKLVFVTAVRSLYRDKKLAEDRLATSGLEVTTVYPTALSNDAAKDDAEVRNLATVSHVDGMPPIARTAVARAMLDAVEDPATIGARLLVTRAGAVH